jgi:hypothetical protein
MKHILTLLIIASLYLSNASAQSSDKRPSANWVVLAGLGYEWFFEEHRNQYLAVEKITADFWHLGIQGARTETFKEKREYSSVSSSWEVGLYAKHFLRGRLSGRKSSLYIGPEFAFGQTVYEIPETLVFPSPPNVPLVYVPLNFQKYMLRWGVQWRLKRAVLEFSSPMGIKSSKSKNISYRDQDDSSFVIQPTIWMGFAF